jgi:AcrR family transcriptional regulator
MDKRDRIIFAAMEVFREKGLEKAKVSDIVKKAGIAQGTFYLYFPSRLSVMPYIAQKMVGESVDALKDRVKAKASLEDQLDQIVEVMFQQARAYRDIFPFIYSGLQETNQLKDWEEIYLPFYGWMSDFLKEQQRTGKVRDNLDSQRTAKLLIALIETTAEQNYWYDSPKESAIEAQKEELMDFIYYALGVKK